MKVEVWDDDGKPLVGEKGELVCTAPFPCMPVSFWNDPDGQKYFNCLFRPLPQCLVPRRLRRADEAWRGHHLRPVGRGA